jgi:nucleotide-binding universal stress UspA family protein
VIAALPALQRVLCAVDVRSEARGALAMASVLAEHFQAHLQGLYVAAPHHSWDNRTDRVKRLIVEHNARQRLESLLAPFERSLAVNSFVTRGSTADVILAHADVHQSDLIVCGISGNSRTGEGSRRLASAVAARAESAVLTVPGDSPACALRRILLVLTEPQSTEPALHWAKTLAHRFGAKISLVRLDSAPRGFWTGFGGASSRGAGLCADSRERRRHAEQHRVAASVHDSELKLGAPLLPERDAASIAALIDRESFDLVIVGLPPAADETEPATTLVERLRRTSAAPTLSTRAAGLTLKHLPSARPPLTDPFERPLAQSA